jgi:predicted SprT family Zn-dependent metalloprotease
MELEHAKALAYDLMSDFGLYYWSFKFDNRKLRFGLCDELTKTISLSKPLVLLNGEEVVEHVILHEIAHALVGTRHKHNHVFQQKAQEIGSIFTTRYPSGNIVYVPKNVIAQCTNCGKIFKKYRMPRKDYSCGKCSGGSFNEEFLLVYKRDDSSSEISLQRIQNEK